MDKQEGRKWDTKLIRWFNVRGKSSGVTFRVAEVEASLALEPKRVFYDIFLDGIQLFKQLPRNIIMANFEEIPEIKLVKDLNGLPAPPKQQ